jgi:hypothetical protein
MPPTSSQKVHLLLIIATKPAKYLYTNDSFFITGSSAGWGVIINGF